MTRHSVIGPARASALWPCLVLLAVALAGMAFACLPAVAQEKGYLGIEIRDLEQAEADALGWPAPRGAMVVSLMDGGPASFAGLRPGDVVVSVDGIEMAGMEPVLDAVASKSPGTAVSLRLLRGGTERQARLLLGKRPGDLDPKTCSKYVPNLGRTIEVPCPPGN